MQNFASLGAIVAHESVFWSYLPLRTSELVVILLEDGYDIGLQLQKREKQPIPSVIPSIK